MPDQITAEERRLIDAHLAEHGARRIPRGVGGETDCSAFGMQAIMRNEIHIRQARDLAIVRDAPRHSVDELAKRHFVSTSTVRLVLLRHDAWAKGQVRRRR
ncbi:hypothetical protein ACQ5SO_17140 [Rhodovulum sp. DZ06]|uniref:hypothetical protein n=1 Tax=Rhodovulum sp. DZ06 TaxID=3425126 RepID=UPI003D340A43